MTNSLLSNSAYRHRCKMFTIRKILEKDLKEVYEMLQDLAAYDKILDKFKLTEEEMRHYIFKDQFPWSCLVAENLYDNSLKGFLFYTFSSINRAFHLSAQVYVDHFYIKPDCRRLGLGKRFLEELKKTLKEHKVNRMEVWCMKTNKIGNEFYKKNGFHMINANIYQHILSER